MTIKKIKRFILPNLPYVFLLWLFAKIGEAYRITPGADTLHKAMGATANLGSTLSQPMLSFNPFDLLIGIIGTAAVYCFVLYKKRHRKNWKKDIEYGSARWSV
jgi:type IV secretion system protein VirD4